MRPDQLQSGLACKWHVAAAAAAAACLVGSPKAAVVVVVAGPTDFKGIFGHEDNKPDLPITTAP